jgi:hypothetical protein
MRSAFGVVHELSKSINPKNLAALQRAATAPKVFARGEQHRNLPTNWARGKLRSRDAGHDLSRRGGLQRTGMPIEEIRRVNPLMSEGSRGRMQAKAAEYMATAPRKRNLP